MTKKRTKTLADRIKAARFAKGLTQEQAAAKAGIRQGAWSEYETGRVENPNFATIKRIAAALDVSLDALAGGDGH